MSLLFIILVIALLIAVNGLYVAAEFSAVSASRPRLANLADEGNRFAQAVLNVVVNARHLDTYVAACQVGITVSSLVLGFYGQSRIMALLAPYLSNLTPGTEILVRSIAATSILLILTILQVILGELIPKNIGIQYPERLAIFTWPAMRWSVAFFRPLIWILNGSGQILLRLLGSQLAAEHTHVHSPEEIMILIEESSAGGILDDTERRLLVNTLQLRNLTARKVMIPRNHMITASVDRSCTELFELLARSPFSRLPLYEGTVDSIVGVIHLKDLIRIYYQEKVDDAADSNCDVRDVMHMVLHIPDSADVEEVMHTMQQHRTNIAIVVDEYGGTAGMITFEDLVEEITGEFQDEFDLENPPLEIRPNNRIRVRGDVLVEDLNDALKLNLPTQAADTVGGLVLNLMGRIPLTGDIVEVDDLVIRVDRTVQHGVAAVSFPISADQIEWLEKLADEA